MELQLARSRSEPAYFHGYLMLPILREGSSIDPGVNPMWVALGM